MPIRTAATGRRRMYLRMVTTSLARRRSRVVVALLAVAIGASTLSGLVTITEDVPRQMARELRSYGANLVVLPADPDVAALDASVVEEVTALLPADDLVGVVGYRYEAIRINSQPLTAAGTDLVAARTVSPYWHVDGAWPTASGQVVLGTDVASLLDAGPGDTVTVTAAGPDDEEASADAVVTGVLSSGAAEDAFVFLDRADLDALVGDPGRLDVVECSVARGGDDLEAIAAAIGAEVPGVTAGPVQRLTQSEAGVLGTLRSLLVIVTVIVLALTAVSVSTTMMAVVAERRTEIGLKKALGAEDRSIAAEFLGEALLLGALGGALGAGLGYVFAQVVSLQVFGRAVSFPWLLAPATVASAVVVTGLACLVPVRRATDIDPAVVLRGE